MQASVAVLHRTRTGTRSEEQRGDGREDILHTLEIEPPIIWSKRPVDGANGRRTRSEEVQPLDGEASGNTCDQPIEGRHDSSRDGAMSRAGGSRGGEWRQRFSARRGERAARAPKEEDALREEEFNRLKRKVVELTMDLDIPR
jgi:hypothetical protein